MRLRKKILLALLTLLVVIQFIQPAQNKSGQVVPTDFAKVVSVPGNVQSILQNACYDCHSDNTFYPWYAHLQPMAWMMARHINEGKEKLNFSAFGSNSVRKQVSKLKEIANQVKDGEMPIASYTMMHSNAKLSEMQKRLVVTWFNNKADSLSSAD